MASNQNYISITQYEFQQITHSLAILPIGHDNPLFLEIVSKFSQKQKHELVGIMWLGRNDLEDWRGIFTVTDGKISDVGTYLLSKRPLLDYLQKGWEKIPKHAKFSNPQEYKDYMNPIIAEPTVKILSTILESVETIEKAMKEFSLDLDKRPNVDRDILVILHSADTIYSAVFCESGIEAPWYQEKVEKLKYFAKFLTDRWLVDVDDPQLTDKLSNGSNREEWIREGIELGLSGVHKYASTLHNAVLQDGLDLLDKK